jgi:A/G-specific adenine glycosylase
MLDQEQNWQQLCAQRYGLRCGNASPLSALRHSFTHFDLEILPLRLRARAATDGSVRESGDTTWIKIEPGKTPAIGLPAPVRKLLESPNLSLDQLQCPEPFTA